MYFNHTDGDSVEKQYAAGKITLFLLNNSNEFCFVLAIKSLTSFCCLKD